MNDHSAETSLLLVRHGQSEWNAQGRWQGQADPPLTELGRLQAHHAAGALPAVDRIVASTLQRAAETAAIIAAELGHDTIHHEPRLMERDAGEWSGLTRAEIDRDYPGYLDAEHRPPGFEPDAALLERTLAALLDVVARHPGERVLVVTHGGVVYAIETMLGVPWRRMGNVEARWLHRRAEAWHLGERLELVAELERTVPDQI
jgi:broad specificity phosphatase PhoE